MRMAKEYRLKPKAETPQGVTLDKPGIYEWAITYPDGSIRRYVGKYTRRSRPMREYHANVERILDQRPYRKASPEGFRRVHRELAAAASEGRTVVLTIMTSHVRYGPPLVRRRSTRLKPCVCPRRSTHAGCSIKAFRRLLAGAHSP